MIVKNEEKVLERCLNSVKDAVDEMIIVDTGSTDKTIEIAQKFGANIYHFDWIDDFSAARNHSLKYATCDYVLVLDADEYIEDTSNLKKDISSGKDYYILEIKNIMNTYEVFSHKAIRLFKNHINIFYKNRLHEILNVNDSNTYYSKGYSHTAIYHTGYLEEIKKEKDKINRNYNILRKEIKENPDSFNYYNLGVTLYNKKDYKEAIDMLQKAYPLSINKPYIHSLILYLSDCFTELGAYEKSIQLLLDAIRAYPTYTDFHYFLGNIYFQLDYLRDAEICYKKCLTLGKPKGYSKSIDGISSYKSYYKLCLIYEELGILDIAFDYAFKTIESNPRYRPALLKYIDFMLKANIPLADVQRQINEIFPITNINRLQDLLFILYDLRHPLLIDYINPEKNIDEPSIMAIALQYSKQYGKSKEIWMFTNPIPEKNTTDLLLLSLLLKDEDLLYQCKNLLNISKNEWQYTRQILMQHKVDSKKLTPAIEDILIILSRNLIILEEYDYFEYISSIIMNGSKNVQLNLAKLLLDYNLMEVCINLLVPLIENHPEYMDAQKLLIKAYMRNHQYTESLYLLNNIKENSQEYWIDYHLFNIYDKLGLSDEKEKCFKKMKNKFPLSL
jgi:glycosyltransferase involved in cell wall biosynthesis